MTEESAANAPAPAPSPRPKAKTSRKAKLIFLLLILAGLGIWQYRSWRGSTLDWPGDFAAAQQRALQENKPLVVFILSFPASEADKWMAENTLTKPQNKKALEEFVRCEVTLSRFKEGGWARKYGLEQASNTPIMLVISPDGKTFHDAKKFQKEDGKIGETDFPKFLKADFDQKAKE